jgi:hypothetical protein
MMDAAVPCLRAQDGTSQPLVPPSFASLTLKMVTAMYAKMLEQLQHMKQLNSHKPMLHKLENILP